MLPWMKDNKKSVAGLIMAKRKPEGGFEDTEPEEPKQNYGLTACAEDILKAIEAKDSKALAKAFQEAFDVLESQPHEEYPHGEEDTE